MVLCAGSRATANKSAAVQVGGGTKYQARNRGVCAMLHSSMADLATKRPHHQRVFVILIAISLGAFAVLSYTAALTKSSTYDEPMHAVAGASHRQLKDFRMDLDNPPLWLYWAELPNWGRQLPLDLPSSEWTLMPRDNVKEWQFTTNTLYRTSDTDGEGFIRRCRPMQIVWGVAIGCILAICAWQIGGALAGLIAAVLYSFEPNFLGHAALLKNDVPIALVTFALVWAVWHVGRRANIYAIVALALVSALTLTVKFSGILLVPIASVLLILRAFMPFEWPAGGRTLTSRRSRLGCSILLILVMGSAAYVGAWASYGFRFAACSDGEPIDTKYLMLTAAGFRAHVATPGASQQEIIDQAFKNVTNDWTTRYTYFALQHKLMPEAWLNGLLVTNEWAKARPAYLCGERSTEGWWYYFPLAVLFKTPLATLLAAAVLVICIFFAPAGFARKARDFLKTPGAWTVVALVVPFSVYAWFSLRSHLNIGVRHVLPLYPFGFLAIAVGLSQLFEQRRRLGYILGGILCSMLIVETVVAWPNYIAFFNVACGGYRGGFNLLSDSNLDWGQDLPLLAKWQQDNPNHKLYFVYDKNVPPIAYGIRFAPLEEDSLFARPTDIPDGNPCIAVGSTVLQKVYYKLDTYDELLKIAPTTVLGGSIYVWADSGPALNWLGAFHIKKERYPEAIAALERAVQLQPNDASSHNNLGCTLTKVGKVNEAADQFRLAVKLNPNDDSAHDNLGVALSSIGDPKAAIPEFERALALQPKRVSSRLNLADALLQTGQTLKAVEQYQAFIGLEPKSVAAYAGVAKALALLNRSQEAIAAAQRGIEIARSNGQEPEAEKIEDWLSHYQIEVKRESATDSGSQPAPSSR